MLRVGWASWLIVTCVVASFASHARAETPLERAHAAIDASDYLAGRAALADALTAGGSSPDELVEIYRLSGTIAAALGDSTAAVDAFTRMLALSPTAKLSVGASPKITKQYEAAKAFFKTSEPLKVKVDTSSSPPSVTITVVSDPIHMIATARAIVRADAGLEQTLDQPGSATITIMLPPGRRIDLRVVALDDHGNRLVEVGSLDVPLVIVGASPAEPPAEPPRQLATPERPAPPHVPEPSHPRPIYLAWWLWAGTSVVFAGAGVGFGLEALGAKNDLRALAATGPAHPFADASPIEARGRRDALFANLGFGAAGAFAIGATILYLTAHHGSKERQVTRVTPVPLRDGGAVVLQGAF